MSAACLANVSTAVLTVASQRFTTSSSSESTITQNQATRLKATAPPRCSPCVVSRGLTDHGTLPGSKRVGFLQRSEASSMCHVATPVLLKHQACHVCCLFRVHGFAVLRYHHPAVFVVLAVR